MTKLSFVTITKNSADRIEGVVKNALGIGDESIVVDTGSVDGTPEIAERAGAKVVEFKGEFDYSSPRCLGDKTATGDWVFHLDDDEVLPLHYRRVVRELADNENFSLIHAPQYVPSYGFFTRLPRMFRNDSLRKFEGLVHEWVYPFGSAIDGDFMIENRKHNVPNHIHLENKISRPRLAERELEDLLQKDVPSDKMESAKQASRLMHIFSLLPESENVIDRRMNAIYEQGINSDDPSPFMLREVAYYLAKHLNDGRFGAAIALQAYDLGKDVLDPVSLGTIAELVYRYDSNKALEIVGSGLSQHINFSLLQARAKVCQVLGQGMSAEYYFEESRKRLPDNPTLDVMSRLYVGRGLDGIIDIFI